MIKKQLLLTLIILHFSTTTAYSINIRLIQIQNLPEVENLMPDLDYVLEHESILKVFIPDEYWEYDLSKQELAEKVIEIVQKLDSYDDADENQDLTLLKGLLSYYLFNLDQKGYYNRAIEELEKIDNYPNRDYRYKWFLGVVYSKSIQPFEAIEQFEFVETRVPEDQLHPLFWADYAEALSFAFMQRKSIEAFEKFSKYGSVNLQSNSMYQSLKEKMTEPAVEMEIKSDDFFQFFERESGLGYLCRPFGIWIPAQGNWTPRLFDYSKHFSGIMYKSQDIEDESGETITYSIASFLFADKDDVMEQFKAMAPIVDVIEDPAFDSRYTVLEIRNPEQYKHIGGAHGYVLIYEPEMGESTGESMEQPSKINTGTGTSYLPFQTIYTRVPGKLSYVFLMDSCENIFEESRADFITFMEKVIIE